MTRRAFTLIELLVVITIIALLIGLLMPVLASARDAAMGTSCMANQDQLMVGVHAYATDNRGRIPFGPEEGKKYNPQRGGEDSGGRDFYVIDGMVTSEIFTRSGEPLGAGLMFYDYMDGAEEAFFCPGTDDEITISSELAKVGTDSVISGYLYRHGGNTFVDLIQFNTSPTTKRMDSRTRIDQLGLNREGEQITALFADNNFQTASGSTFEFLDRSNHDRVFSNIAYADGHVEQRSNRDDYYVADIGGTTLINGLDRILRVFERADVNE